MTETPHSAVRAPGLAEPVGYSHAVVAAPGRLVSLGGQTGQGPDGVIRGTTLVEQWDRAAANLLMALRAAGGGPEHLVAMTVYVTDMAAYRSSLRSLGQVWRSHFGRRYPAMALIGVVELVDPAALVELSGVAVIP